MQRRGKGIVPGLVIIFLGIIFLMQSLGCELCSWDRIWPIFLLGVGLIFLGGYFFGTQHDSGLAFAGTVVTLVGLFFFAFSYNLLEWDEMERLWPVFPLIGGVGFVVLWAAEGFRDWGILVPAVLALVVGLAAFPFTFGLWPSNLANILVNLWPVALIIIGLGLLAQFAFGRRR